MTVCGVCVSERHGFNTNVRVSHKTQTNLQVDTIKLVASLRFVSKYKQQHGLCSLFGAICFTPAQRMGRMLFVKAINQKATFCVIKHPQREGIENLTLIYMRLLGLTSIANVEPHSTVN